MKKNTGKRKKRLELRGKKADLLLCIAVAGAALLAYSQFFGIAIPEFDAATNILSHKEPGVAGVIGILAQPQQHYHTSSANYRPVEGVLQWIFFQASGMDLRPLHALNFLLHAANSVLVFLVARRLLGKRSAVFSFIAALVFALHPIHINTVLFVSRQCELLAGLSALASLLLLMRFLESGKKRLLCLSALFCALGVFSKEIGIAIPAALFFYAAVFSKEKKFAAHFASAAKTSALFFAGAAVYVLARFFALGGIGGYSLAQPSPVASTLLSIFLYLFYPAGFTGINFSNKAFSLLRNPVLSAGIALAFFACSAIALFLLSRKRARNAVFLAAWLILLAAVFMDFGDFFWWYSYSIAIPFSIICAMLLAKGIEAAKGKSGALKKAAGIALAAIVSMLFISLAALSPLFAQYPQFGEAGESVSGFLEKTAAAAGRIPGGSTVLLLNTPEYLFISGKTINAVVPLSNESSALAFLEWKQPGKKFSVFSLTAAALYYGREKAEFAVSWSGNCSLLIENKSTETASIYSPSRWSAEKRSLDGVVLTPSYEKEKETMAISFPRKGWANTFLLAFDGNSVRAMSMADYCK